MMSKGSSSSCLYGIVDPSLAQELLWMTLRPSAFPMRIQGMMHAMQARGKVNPDNTSLWGCLSRVEDQSTGIGSPCTVRCC